MHGMFPTLLYVSLSLALVFVIASAQECYTGCASNLTVCSNIQYQLYASNSNVSQVVSDEAVAIYYLQLIPFSLITNERCSAYLPLFVCNIAHPACDNTTTVPTPVRPCRSMCTDLLSACGKRTVDLLATSQPALAAFADCSNSSAYAQEPSESCSVVTNPTPIPCNNSKPAKPLVYSGICQPFDASLAPNAGETCAPFVSKIIFVPSSDPAIITELDKQANITIATVAAARVIVPIICYKSLVALLCPIIFPTCITFDDVPGYPNTSAVVGQMICASYCLEASAECAPLFKQLNITKYLPKCKQHSQYAPTDIYNASVGDATVQVKCRNFMFPKDAAAPFTLPEIACPIETGRKLHPSDDDPMCGFHCPDSSYTAAEWRALVELTQIGSSLSLICMLFLVLSYLVTSTKRRFPSTTHINEFVATAMFSISFLIGGRHPEKDVWCVDEGTNATLNNNATCGIQGFFFIFFGLALAAWCCIISFIMFYAIVITRTKSAVANLRRYSICFYLFGWGLPLIFAVAAAASHKIGYGPPLAWCFISFKGFGEGTGVSSDYLLFYIPMGVLFVAILLMFWITIAILILYRNKSSESSVLINAQVRVLIFIFVVFAICFTIFEWRFQIEAESQKGDLSKVGINWTYCKIGYQMGITNSTAGCPGDVNPARIDYAHTAFESFLLSGLGVLIFIAFAFDKHIYLQWATILRLMYTKQWKKLQAFIMTGRDPYASHTISSHRTSARSTLSHSHSGGGSGGSGSGGGGGERDNNSSNSRATHSMSGEHYYEDESYDYSYDQAYPHDHSMISLSDGPMASVAVASVAVAEEGHDQY